MYVILAGAIVMNTIYNSINNHVGKTRLSGTAGRFLYLTFVFAAGAVVTLGFMAAGGQGMSAYTLAMGTIFGVCHVAATVMLVRALSIGPMALVNLMVACSMLLPTFSGMLIWSETVAGPQWVGVALMVVSLILCANVFGGSASHVTGIGRRWVAVSLCTAVLAGGLGVIQKIFQSSAYTGEVAGFLAVSFVVSAAGAFLAWRACAKRGGATAVTPGLSWSFVAITVGAGVLVGALNHVNLYLIGALPAVLFFPVCSGGVILCSAVVGRALFKEKMSRAQWLGFAFGVAAILLLGNVAELFS